MIDILDYDALAEQAAGNWADFGSFAWFDRPENPDTFAIVYTHHRDSDILDRANAKAIAAELAPFIESGDVIDQHHSHWAVGWIEGYAIRVFDDDGNVTAAFRAWCDIQARLADYPVLCDETFGEMEIEAQGEAWENFYRGEFVREIQRRLDVTLDESDSSAVLDLFEAVQERSNTYWEGDEINLDRIVAAVSYDDARKLIVPVLLTVYQDGFVLVTGSIIGDEWESDLPLYDDEFGACVLARGKGADSVTLGGHVLTWRAN